MEHGLEMGVVHMDESTEDNKEKKKRSRKISLVDRKIKGKKIQAKCKPDLVLI